MVYCIELDLFEMIWIVKYDCLDDLRARWILGVPLNLLESGSAVCVETSGFLSQKQQDSEKI